jgi:hypothetical protein
MNKRFGLALILAVSGGSLGCHARSAEDYRRDTRALLETRSERIRSCYDSALAADENATGTVVVRFTVAEDTGTITSPSVLPESTAPAPLGECVVQSLEGLALDPADARKGDATFVWEFQTS